MSADKAMIHGAGQGQGARDNKQTGPFENKSNMIKMKRGDLPIYEKLNKVQSEFNGGTFSK